MTDIQTVNRYAAFVTPYTDKVKTLNLLGHNPALGKLAADFCKAFGCKVGLRANAVRDYDPNMPPSSPARHSVAVFTPGGQVAGILTALCLPENYHAHTDEDYSYSSSLVQKSRSRGSRNERESKKIATLIRTVRREGEEPTDAKLAALERNGMDFALRAVRSSTYGLTTSVQLRNAAIDALTKHFLGIDSVGVEQHRDDIKNAYEKYVEARKKTKDGAETVKRFAKGFKAIGMVCGGMSNFAATYDVSGNLLPAHGDVSYFLYTEAHVDSTSDNSKIVCDLPTKRYDRLSDIPNVAVDVAIITAGMEGDKSARKTQPMCLPFDDAYYMDLDIATGSMHNTVMWVLIPTTPYEG